MFGMHRQIIHKNTKHEGEEEPRRGVASLVAVSSTTTQHESELKEELWRNKPADRRGEISQHQQR